MRYVASLTVFLALCAGGSLARAAGPSRPSAPAGGAPARAPLLVDLAKHESVHFTMYTDFDDDDYTRRLQGDIEKYFSELQKEFWDYIPRQHREAHIEMVVLSNARAFDTFGAQDAGAPHGKKGYLNLRTGRMVILRQDKYYKDIMIAVHELTHVFNYFCTPSTPVWLDEGMAQFYANYAAQENGIPNVRGGVNKTSLDVIDAALKRGSLPRLSQLLRMSDAGFYGPGSRENFAEAWALVFYLRRGLGHGGDNMFSEYYSVIARGGDDYTAFTNVYGANMELFEKMWLLYIKRLYQQQAIETPAVDTGGKGPQRETPTSSTDVGKE